MQDVVIKFVLRKEAQILFHVISGNHWTGDNRNKLSHMVSHTQMAVPVKREQGSQ